MPDVQPIGAPEKLDMYFCRGCGKRVEWDPIVTGHRKAGWVHMTGPAGVAACVPNPICVTYRRES